MLTKTQRKIQRILDAENVIRGYSPYDRHHIMYLIESHDVIRAINRLWGINSDVDSQNNLQPDQLSFGQSLALMHTHYPFPVSEALMMDIESTIRFIDFHHIFPRYCNSEWTFDFPIDTGDELLQVWEKTQNIDEVNEYIKSMLPDNIDYDFASYYAQCADYACWNLIRIKPDSYNWELNAIQMTDSEYICEECSIAMTDSCIVQMNQMIDRDELFPSFPKFLGIPDGFFRLIHPDGQYAKWESGFEYDGDNPPLTQAKIIRSIRKDGKPVFECIFRKYPSQFRVKWEVLARLDKLGCKSVDDVLTETGYDADYWAVCLGSLISKQESDALYLTSQLSQLLSAN